jgi:hypothetical protein
MKKRRLMVSPFWASIAFIFSCMARYQCHRNEKKKNKGNNSILHKTKVANFFKIYLLL